MGVCQCYIDDSERQTEFNDNEAYGENPYTWMPLIVRKKGTTPTITEQ